MKERITLQEIVAMNNTPKAKALIVKYGYSPAKNYNDLIYKLFRFTKEYQQEALEELSNIHPHKDLILNYNCKPTVSSQESKSIYDGGYSDYCQCPTCRRMKIMNGRSYHLPPIYSNADGSISNKKADLKDFIPMIVIFGFVSAVLVTAMKNN